MRARLATILATVALAVALAVAGCGGGSSSESSTQKIRKAADQFSAAFGSGDIKKACALFDPSVMATSGGNDCVSIYGEGGTSGFERSFLTAKVERVVVTGDTATVGLSNGQILRFKKVAGDWRVEDLGGSQNAIG